MGTGIIKDMTCTGSLNHAVTAVGYNADYILVKNSWGTDWGEAGFVRYMRGHHNCGLYLDSYYPQLEVTNVADSNPDEATDYTVPDNDDRFDPKICKDKYMGGEISAVSSHNVLEVFRKVATTQP